MEKGCTTLDRVQVVALRQEHQTPPTYPAASHGRAAALIGYLCQKENTIRWQSPLPKVVLWTRACTANLSEKCRRYGRHIFGMMADVWGNGEACSWRQVSTSMPTGPACADETRKFGYSLWVLYSLAVCPITGNTDTTLWLANSWFFSMVHRIGAPATT